MSNKISILKYGTGNLNSIIRAINHFGYEVELVQNTNEIVNCNKLILPGIGASKYVMDYLNASERNHAIIELINKGRPVLGICLGMQILLSENEEFGIHRALDIIPGKVLNINSLSKDLVVPHMGWTKTEYNKVNDDIKLIEDNQYFYYAHSFYCKVNEENIYAYCKYHDYKIPAVISNKENVWGTQFHPELSSSQGLQVIKKFINI
tara:strand:- start:18409 stop:19029 length:621 start_codon:yes stop_codon:yes gene_type:complete